MKLSTEQLLAASNAIQRGLSCAAWEGVSDRPWWELSMSEQEVVLASVRATTEREIQWMGPELRSHAQKFLDRMNLASVQAEEQRWLEMCEKTRLEYAGSANSRRVSASGLRMGLNDCLSQEPLFDEGQRRAVDRRLAAKSLPSVRVLAAQIKEKHAAILKRGRVRDEEEYYLIQEVLAAVDYPMEETERHRLAELAAQFDQRRSRA